MANAKVFARVFSYASPADQPDGTMVITVEWKMLNGARRSGKSVLVVDEITSDDKLRADLRDGLAAHLSQLYAPEHFRPRDIVGYSV